MSYDDKQPLLESSVGLSEELSVEDRLTALEERLDALTETCNTKCSDSSGPGYYYIVMGLIVSFLALLGYLDYLKSQKQSV